MEKNVRLGLLMTYYPAALTTRQRQMMAMHFDEDMSLAEIAEHEGVSRQAVHDAIRRGEATLEKMETENHLLASRLTLIQVAERLEMMIEQIRDGKEVDKSVLTAWLATLDEVRQSL